MHSSLKVETIESPEQRNVTMTIYIHIIMLKNIEIGLNTVLAPSLTTAIIQKLFVTGEPPRWHQHHQLVISLINGVMKNMTCIQA